MSRLQFRRTAQGVHWGGELKGFNPVGVGKPTARIHSNEWRGARSGEGLNSHPSDNPIPSDLGLGRVKPGESLVEARRGSDVQFVPLTRA